MNLRVLHALVAVSSVTDDGLNEILFRRICNMTLIIKLHNRHTSHLFSLFKDL